MIDLCRLTYDWNDRSHPAPGPGCYLRGHGIRGPSSRAYLIHAARLVKSKVHPERYALSCERVRAADIPAGIKVYWIHWYSRTRSKRTLKDWRE